LFEHILPKALNMKLDERKEKRFLSITDILYDDLVEHLTANCLLYSWMFYSCQRSAAFM